MQLISCGVVLWQDVWRKISENCNVNVNHFAWLLICVMLSVNSFYSSNVLYFSIKLTFPNEWARKYFIQCKLYIVIKVITMIYTAIFSLISNSGKIFSWHQNDSVLDIKISISAYQIQSLMQRTEKLLLNCTCFE